jgi:hypothetical protein
VNSRSSNDGQVGGFDPAAELRTGMALCSWQSWDLWVATMPIGGFFTHEDVKQIISGVRAPSQAEYSVLAATLNEQCHELGGDHPVPMRLGKKS